MHEATEVHPSDTPFAFAWRNEGILRRVIFLRQTESTFLFDRIIDLLALFFSLKSTFELLL